MKSNYPAYSPNTTTKQQPRTICALLLLFVVVENIHPIFSLLAIKSVLQYLRYFLFAFSFVYVICKSWRLLFTVPVVLYFIWCIYVFINNLQQGYGFFGTPLQMFLAFFPSFTSFFVCVYAYARNEDLLVRTVILSLYMYCIFAMLLGFANSSERLGGELLNANSIGIRAALIYFFLMIRFIRKKISVIGLIAFAILPLIVIIMTASRTAVLIVAILSVYFVIRKSSSRIAVFGKILLLIVAYYAIGALMDNTFLGERLADTTTQIEGSQLETGTFLDYLGDRGYQYYISAPIIEQYPYFGIGMGNFMSKISEATNVYHSEYLIQLCECGLIGFILYFFLYYWSIKNLIVFKHRKLLDYNIFCISLLCIIAVMGAGVVTRISYYSIYNCCLGFIVSTLLQRKKVL